MVFELGAQMLLLLQIDGGGCDVIVNPTTALPMLRIDLDLVCFFFYSETPDDMEKNSHLKGLQQLGPLTVFRADMDEEGSFDDAVAGCDYAFLVAAPVNLWAQDPEVRKHRHHSPHHESSLSHNRNSL